MIVPPVAVQVTAELYAPVPWTTAEHCDVWICVIDAGVAVTVTDVMVIVTAVTVRLADPNLVVSWVEVAVMVAVPVPPGVNTPAEVIEPPVAVQVTDEL